MQILLVPKFCESKSSKLLAQVASFVSVNGSHQQLSLFQFFLFFKMMLYVGSTYVK